MVLAPDGLATFDFKTDTSTATLGCIACDVDDKVEMQDITCDTNTARARYPGLNDGTVTASFIEDDDDAGQDKIRAAKPAHTLYSYVVKKGTRTFTFSAYVESIKRPGGPGDVQKMDVTFAVSGGISET
jgi:hypothetical protein